MRRLLCALTLGVLLAISIAGSASAHQGNPNFRSVVHGIDPPVPGLTAQVLNYDADVLLTNESGETVVVEGYDGEPYLRFSPDGTVEANLNSPAYYLNTDRYGTADVPANADPEAEPDWKVVGGTGEFQWHDHRSHYMSTATPPQVTDPDVKTKIFDYEIPLEVAGKPATIDGTLFWVGQSGFPILPFIGAGLLALASIVLVLVVRRRRRSTENGPDDERGVAEQNRDDARAGSPESPAGDKEAW